MDEAKGRKGYRAKLVAELAERDRAELEGWLSQQLDQASFAPRRGRLLAVTLCELAGRDRRLLAWQARSLGELAPGRLLLRPAARLEARPRRGCPRLLLLPFDGRGSVLRQLARLDAFAAFAPRPATLDGALRRLHMTVAAARSAAAEERDEGPLGWPAPPALPAAMRRPMDAVRLALYPSKTTLESRESTPLAQVELPQAATVR